MNIRKIFIAILIIVVTPAAELLSGEINKEEIMNAMRDELQRNIENLSLESVQQPYFIEYELSITDAHIIRASLGSIVDSSINRRAELTVTVRVGDYEFDNSNFFDVGLSFFGSGDNEETFKNRSIPIELDYEALRRELWLATDAAYKQAAEIYSKKEAAMKNRMRKDTTHDFMKVEPQVSRFVKEKPELNLQMWTAVMKRASGVFADYPEINVSTAVFEYLPQDIFYVNTEGMEYIKTKLYTGMELVAATQAEDGMPIGDYFSAFGKTPDDLPGRNEIIENAEKVAENVVRLRNAPAIDGPYSGPMIFRDQAAAQIFAQLFAPNFVTQRKQITEFGNQGDDKFGAFQSKIGGRVLPEFMSVYAKPNMKEYNNKTLIGNYPLDDNGVDPQDVKLVENGFLKNLLSARVPTRRVRETNGHERGGAAMLSNIVVESDADHSKSYEQMRDRMLELCEMRELPYGLVITRIMDKNVLTTSLFRATSGVFEIPRGDGKFVPVEMYRVYPDGREELVRGGEGAGFNVQTFKDILSTSKDVYAMNYLAPAVISWFVSGGDPYVGASIITPDLFFEDGEIRLKEGDFPRPPLISSPLK